MRVWLYQSSHARVSSLAWRMVAKLWPWRRSTFREANRVSLGALSQQLPLRLIEAVMPHSTSGPQNSRHLNNPVLPLLSLEHPNRLIRNQYRARRDTSYTSIAFGRARFELHSHFR